jgi:glycosyltransferase involved in cell wall biosynthesis
MIQGDLGFRRRTLFSEDDFHRHSTSKILSVVGDALSQAQPEAVAIAGWSERCSLAALHWCNKNRVPAIVMSDSPEWIVKRRWWKEAVKRQLLRSVSAGLAAGNAHRTYLVGLGLQRDRIFLGFDIVDNEYFAREAENVRNNAADFRRRLQLPHHYFLASSRFVPKKNIEGLLTAYATYRRLSSPRKPALAEQEPWDLVLLGDGPLKPLVDQTILDLGLRDYVHTPGFIQYGRLPAYYALAGAFVMPSLSETWGLTVNEAMACGLPVVVSTRCGCATELVVQGKNGYIMEPWKLGDFARILADLSRLSETDLLQMGRESVGIIAKWGPDLFASSLQSAAATAVIVGPRDGSLARNCLLRLLIGFRAVVR